ncbi:type II toxin-antitoxin system HigB family toxin [bacterium]|nr:MAG: type II toxin-antitoxin system HigB family toxin [bacterium]
MAFRYNQDTPPVNLIGLPKLTDFWTAHPRSRRPLETWKSLLEKNTFRHFAHLKQTFGAVDYSAPDTIFDVGGNKYRVVAVVNFETQIAVVKAVMTHEDYDSWSKRRKK